MGSKQAMFVVALLVVLVAGPVAGARVDLASLLISSSNANAEARSHTTPWVRPTTWFDRLMKESICDEPSYRTNLLNYIKEMPFLGLFDDIKGTTKFEASGMTIADHWLWVVFDNLHALGRIDEQFEFKDPRNLLVGPLGDDSQFEGLTYSEVSKHFFAVEEVYDSEEHGLHPFVHEIEVTKDAKTYTTVARCPIHFVLTHENKGFEGLHLHEHDNHRILMGLCEGEVGEVGRHRRGNNQQ